MAAAMASLAAGLCAGLLRLGWNHASLTPDLATVHGPLMVCGFLGTLIGLERAVALRALWAYGAPLLTGAGGLLLIAGAPSAGAVLLTAGAGLLVVIFVALLRRQSERFMQVMAAGALAWLAGTALWAAGSAVPEVVLWWVGFLVLTIAGERLELSRVLMHAPRVGDGFALIVLLLGAAVAASVVDLTVGTRAAGAVLMLLAAWLVRFDVARHSVRSSGLTRYIAVCLLAGYAWLFLGGTIMLIVGGQTAGLAYDAYLHAVFVGFVFSMIFAHAPVIFPSILDVPVFYRSYFYVPLALLHVSLALRTLTDVFGWMDLRRWAGLAGAAAIVFFLVAVVGAVVASRREKGDVLTANGW